MRTFGKREKVAVFLAVVVAALLFFGQTIWGFLFEIGTPDAASSAFTSAKENPKKMANISTVEGLEIYDKEVGTGAEAVAGKIVSAHYVGTLASDGSKFDSSLDRGKPYDFKLGAGDVIKGWDLGIAGMKVGGVRQLVISPEFGYGQTGIGPIPPNSTLIFEIQLVDVK